MSKAPQGQQVLPRRTGWFWRPQTSPPSLMVAQPLTEEEAAAELEALRQADEASKRPAEEALRAKEETRRAKEEARRTREGARRAEAQAKREEKTRRTEELRRAKENQPTMRSVVSRDAPPAERVVRFAAQRLMLSLGTVGCVVAAAGICVLMLGAYSLGRRSAPEAARNGMPPAAAVVNGENGTVRTPLLPMQEKPQADVRTSHEKQPAASNPDLSELLKVPAARRANLVAPNQPAAVAKPAPAPPPSGPAPETLNYLQIESFNVTRYRSGDQLKEDLDAVRAFLDQRGVKTTARRLGNGYVLFSERGFPPGSQHEAQRAAFRKQVEDLGKEYRRSGGLYEFKSPLFVSHAASRGGQPA